MKSETNSSKTPSKINIISAFSKRSSLQAYEMKPRFECTGSGVYFVDVRKDTSQDGKGGLIECAPLWICDKLELIGKGQDDSGAAYRVFRYRNDFTQKIETSVFPLAEAGTQAGVSRLRGMGLAVGASRKQSEALAMYLQTEGDKSAWQVVSKAGWHGEAYILPSGEVLQAQSAGRRIIYKGDTSRSKAYQTGGTLEQWRQEIARYAAGNSRLCLALGTAFAAPLMGLIRAESGGFHLAGDSRDGKTTAARVALSVWCNHEEGLLTWQGTALGFNNTAASLNDGLLVLDEIGQAKPRVVSDTVYTVMNGVNKIQARHDGGNRALSRWRILVLSTGEKTPDIILKEQADWNAGQNARLPTVRADAGKGYGIYDTLHGFTGGAELSEHLADSATQFYGEAGRAFIRLIDEQSAAKVKESISAFLQMYPDLSGQARTVAKRFAIAAAALEMASTITWLAAGVGMAGIKQCFDEWLERNGTGKYEDAQIIKQAEDFFGKYAYSVRFSDWPLPLGSKTGENAAGYTAVNSRGEQEYLVIPAVFEREICGTFEPRKVCFVLHDIGWLNKPASGRGWKVQKTRGTEKVRFYSFNGIAVSEEGDNS